MNDKLNPIHYVLIYNLWAFYDSNAKSVHNFNLSQTTNFRLPN